MPRSLALLTVWALVLAGALVAVSPASPPVAVAAPSGASADGRITMTMEASPSSLSAGGGQVTVTYRVTNTTDSRAYYVGLADDRCPTPTHSTGMKTDSVRWYIPAKSTATFSCNFFAGITQTETASATFTTNDGSGAWTDSTATASIPLTVAADQCDTMWYSSVVQGGETGRIGTITPRTASGSTTVAMTPRWTISQLAGSPFDSSAAFAVDPRNPTVAYFVPSKSGGSYGGLYRLDTTNGKATRVAAPAPATDTVRLAMDGRGTLWSWNSKGVLYSLAVETTTTWTPHTISGARSTDGKIVLNGTLIGDLGSGDLVVGGAGNLWMLAANGNTTYLLAVTDEQAVTTNPQAVVVGRMNSPTYGGYYNGLAFGPGGKLLASAGSQSSNNATNTLYEIDVATGLTTPLASAPNAGNGSIGDLGSCALPRSRLQVLKRAITAQQAVRAGDEITYQIEVANLGALASVDATLRDVIPDTTTYKAGSTTLNGVSVGDVGGAMPFTSAREIHGPGTPRAGIVPAGETATVRFTVRVNGSVPENVTTIANQATVFDLNNPDGKPSDDPSVPGATDPTVSPIARPRIGITKSASSTSVSGGGPVTYTYTVSNLGAEPLAGVTVTDTATRGGTQVTPYTCANPGVPSGDLNGDGVLDRYETWTYTCKDALSWTAADGTASTTVTNTATARATGIVTGTRVIATSSAGVTLSPKQATIELSKQPGTAVGPDSETGEVVTSYSVVVANTGQLPGPYGPITDTPTPPPGMRVTGVDYVRLIGDTAGTSTPATPAGADSYTLGEASTIGAGETHRYRVRVRSVWTSAQPIPELTCAKDGGIRNTATLPAGQEAGGADDNTACVDAPHPPNPSLTMVKTGTAPAPAGAGSDIDYRFTVTNTSPNIFLTALAIEDPRISGATCAHPTLAPGAVTTCSGTARLTTAEVTAQHIDNTATATALPAGFTSRISSAPSSVSVPLNTEAGVSLTKSADATGLSAKKAGDKVTYTFTVTNTGDKTLQQPVISDPTLGLTDLKCGAGALATGATAACTADYTLTEADIIRGRVANIATVSALGQNADGTKDAVPVTAVATTTISGMDGRSGLWLEKQQLGKIVDADASGDDSVGDTLWYTFRVRNYSDQTVNGVVVTDDKAGSAVVCDDKEIVAWGSTACRLTFPYKLTEADIEAGAVVNTATATATASADGRTLTSNKPSVTTKVTYAPKLMVTKVDGPLQEAKVTEDTPAGPSKGDTIAYAVTVTNRTALPMTDLTLTDPLLGDATLTCARASGPTTTIAARETLTCKASKDYVLTRADVDAREVTNTVTADARPAAGTLTPVTASVTTPIIPLPRLTMTKAHTGPADGQAKAGDPLSYSFELTNAGTGSLRNLRIVDPKLGVDDWCTNEEATLTPGQSLTCNERPYTVTQHDYDVGIVTNDATGRASTSSDANPLLLEAAASDTFTTAVPPASMTLTKHFDRLVDVDASGGPSVGDLLGVQLQSHEQRRGDSTLPRRS